MKTPVLELLEKYRELSEGEQEVFFSLLQKEQNRQAVRKTNNLTISQNGVQRCPRCGSFDFRKNGKQKDGTQRYHCNSCMRGFLSTSGSALYASSQSPKTILLISECFSKNFSIRKTADICHMAPSTILRWKKKMVAFLRTMVPESGCSSFSALFAQTDFSLPEFVSSFLLSVSS